MRELIYQACYFKDSEIYAGMSTLNHLCFGLRFASQKHPLPSRGKRQFHRSA